jgi:hypothetical protein
MINDKLTGRKRHRVHTLGFFKRKQILVLQYEVEGFVPKYNGGPSVDGSFKTWWVDSKPEWELSYVKDMG